MKQESEAGRTDRLKFIALAAVFIAPMLGATIWYFVAPFTAPAATAHGELITPARPLEPFQLELPDGGVHDLAATRGHWTIVHAVTTECSEACDERIHYTRQIRDALGHERVRVRRLYVAASAAAEPDSTLLQRHPDLTVARSADGAFIDQLPGYPDPETVYLVDPLGNVMLRFGPEIEPRHILSDIKKVLRVSRIG